jgi:hypothetical protein
VPEPGIRLHRDGLLCGAGPERAELQIHQREWGEAI